MGYEMRSWWFDLDGRVHALDLGGNSIWTDKPRHAVLDGTKVKIGWRKTTSWWRDWNVARWRWDFAVGGHAATLHCEVSQPPSARKRMGTLLGGTPKAAARGVATSTVVGAAMGGGVAASTMAEGLEKMRRWSYVLEIDGRVVSGRPTRT